MARILNEILKFSVLQVLYLYNYSIKVMKKIYHKFPAAAILLQILIIENELTKFRVPSVLRQNIVSNGVK